MAVIAYTVRGSLQSWVAKDNNGGLRWTENIAEAAEFADNAAVDTFLSGRDSATVASGLIKTQTAGQPHYGKKLH